MYFNVDGCMGLHNIQGGSPYIKSSINELKTEMHESVK
jgi:hypothetical protein